MFLEDCMHYFDPANEQATTAHTPTAESGIYSIY